MKIFPHAKKKSSSYYLWLYSTRQHATQLFTNHGYFRRPSLALLLNQKQWVAAGATGFRADGHHNAVEDVLATEALAVRLLKEYGFFAGVRSVFSGTFKFMIVG